MKRLVLALGIALAAGLGAYAQSAVVQPSLDPVQAGTSYAASFCQTPSAVPGIGRAGTFYMRVTRVLNRDWVEVDYASYPEGIDPTRPDRRESARLNLAQLCMVKPMTP